MRFGVVILPDERFEVTRPRWQRAEAMGFDHAWTYDHLTWRTLRDGPWFGAIPTLTAAALATSRIRLGTLVTSPNFRHPVPLAKELMTLDDISGGRLTVGIGAGGQGWDATALGQAAWSPRERADRFDEFVRLLDRLLVEEEIDYEGRFYSASEARGLPGCRQRPRLPFSIAGIGPRGMRLAAEFGESWVTTDGRGDVREQCQRLDAACAEQGREGLDRIALLGFSEKPLASVDAFDDTIGRMAEIGFTDVVVHWPRHAEPFLAENATFERIAALRIEGRAPAA